MSDKKVAADLKFAIQRQGHGGADVSIASLLDQSQNSYDYWHEAAEQLHRLNMHYDALDCWKIGEQKLLQSQDLSNIDIECWYGDMVETLSSILSDNGDGYLAQEAYQAAVRFHNKIQTSETLSLKIKLAQKIAKPREEVLVLIEQYFEEEKKLKVDIAKYILGANYPGDNLESINELAECYLWNDQVSDALRIWSKIKFDGSESANEKMCSAIYHLNLYASSKNIDASLFVPDDF